MTPDWYDILRRYGLAACCVVGPLRFGLGGVLYAGHRLLPDPRAIDLPYAPVQPAADESRQANKTTEDTNQPPQVAPAASVVLPKTSTSAPDAGKTGATDVLEFWTLGEHYRGRIGYTIASAFLFVISGAVFLFALCVIWPRLGWRWTLTTLTGFAAIAAGVAVGPFVPPGREFVVKDLLNKADKFFPYTELLQIRDGTGTAADALAQLNVFVSLWPIGMLLTTLSVLSVRAKDDDLTFESLRARLTLLRVALGLGSTFLVIAVLAQKALMEWPLSLILMRQAAGLRLLADALTLQLGAQGTIALIAAFGPAIAAWSLDAAALRRKSQPNFVAATPTQPADPPIGKVQQSYDGFVFAPLSAIASIIAVLAPLLASPFVDALKSIFSMSAKVSP